jgi:NADP-dependent 3-hydroxy acid dehydrogenase YdfG
MEDQHWQNTMQVNLLSNMKLIRDYVKSRKDQWSKIVVIGSTATDHIWPAMLPYTISKIGLENFCKGLRQEISKNTGIVTVRPGLVKTNFNMSRHMGTITKEISDQWYDSQAHLMPEDFVPVIKNILCDRSHSIKEITISL